MKWNIQRQIIESYLKPLWARKIRILQTSKSRWFFGAAIILNMKVMGTEIKHYWRIPELNNILVKFDHI